MVDDIPTWARFVGTLGPLFTFGAALIAAGIAWRSHRHRTTADRRDQLWKQTQWAVDYATKEDETQQQIGLDLLTMLAEQEFATKDQGGMIALLADLVLAPLVPMQGDSDPTVEYSEMLEETGREDG